MKKSTVQGDFPARLIKLFAATGLAADAGGHIGMDARVVTSSWLVQIVALPS